MKLTYHNEIVQNTPEWLDLRLSRIGGSECSPLFSYEDKPNKVPAGLISLAIRKAGERKDGYYEEGYTSPAMEAGKEFEPMARDCFEELTFLSVDQPGYISLGENYGFSPDGIAGDSVLEIKCPETTEWVRYRYTRQIKKAHLYQMYWGMYLTGLSSAIYFVYHHKHGHTMQTISMDQEKTDLLDIRTKMYADLLTEILTAAK